jgi:segregation and condensation protein B
MDPDARRALEALLLVADRPVETTLLAQLLEVPAADVDATCAELAAEYEAEHRGFALVRVAGGYRYQTHPDVAPYVERFVLEGQTARLSSAALETLAIVAYKQPISRAQIAAIRGVNVDSVLRTLEQRGCAVRYHAAVPGTSRPRLARRPPTVGSVRPRCGGGRSARGDAAPR